MVAIGGIDASNAPTASRAGAAGVAVIRAAPTPRRLRARSMRGSLTSASSACSPSSSAAASRRGSSTTPPGRRRLVVTQDALVEGVHFRLDWISWRDLGFRAAAVNLSDLAAVRREARRR